LILLFAVAIGLLAGIIRARIQKRRINLPSLRLTWLVILAFFAQALVFQLPATRYRVSEPVVSAALVGSQVLLVIFAGANLKQKGFWALTLGLLLNFIVITANGGWMPISPETVMQLIPGAMPGSLHVGSRFGASKDRILEPTNTVFPWLSDQFLLPEWIPIHVAFSLGDVFIAIGAFLFLWSLGGPQAKS